MDPSTLKTRCLIGLAAVFLLNALLVRPVDSSEKNYGVIGLQVVPTSGGELVVLQVIDGSPAAIQGLKPGDFIFRVDDRSLAGSDFAEVVSSHLWGEVGTSVTLHYLRPGLAGKRSVTLQRIELNDDPPQTPGVRMLAPER